MWKLKSLKKLLFILALSLCFAVHLFAQEDSSDLKEFQDLASSLSQESYSQELKSIQLLIDSMLQELQSAPQTTSNEQYQMELASYSEEMKSDSFASMPLSSQLKTIRNAQKSSSNLITTFLTQQTELSNWSSSVLKNMNVLLDHFNRLLTIMQKMQESANQDLKIAIDELVNASTETENVKLRLEVAQKLAENQAEEIAALSGIKQRVRVSSYVELAIGIPTLVLGCLPIWTQEQQNIRNLFLGVGSAITIAGGVGFFFTITF